MNNNMTAMNNMGGPVGAAGNAGPMMNNGAAGRLPPGSMSNSHHSDSSQRAQLNTYIYEYFLKNEMLDCARALLASKQPINVDGKNSPRRRDDNGVNGLGDDPMDTDSKEDMKRIEDFPAPRTHASEECPDACFLFDWWCLFWDMFNGQHGKSARENIVPFINHTQHQTRVQQERQLAALRNQNPNPMMVNQQQYQQMMMRNGAGQAGGPIQMNPNDLQRAAMANRSKATPQQMQMMQQKHNQLQQNGAEMDGRQRPQSPGSAENAPSPSKRPRLENGGFPQGMQNGRGQPQGMAGQGQNSPSSIMQANQMLRTNNIDPNSLNQGQLQNFQDGNPNVRANAINTYSKNLSQQQKAQIPANMTAGVSPATQQASPMMMENAGLYEQNYNTNGMGPNGGRGGPSQGVGANQTGNHALQDYQMQLMLLEQQNKKRLMMARQEQDSNMGGNNIRQDGGPGQQYQGASPNGPRSGASPGPGDMKRGTPQMGNIGIPGSPLPDGQSRNSPAMGFNPNHVDPNTAPAFYNTGNMKMEAAGMGQVMPNGMRPPSSHPQGYNGQAMTQQQMIQRQQGGGPFNPGFQGGPNGAPMMMQNPSQSGGPPAQGMNTPQQRAMPPPQAPPAGNAPNGQNNRSNTQPSSPQQPAAPPTPSQSNKAAPGKGKKNDKEPRKRPQKKGSVATLNAGATPSADSNAAGGGNDAGPATTPTPATPVTPLHPNSFKNGQGNQQGGQGAPGGPQGGNNGGMNGQQQQAGNGQAAPAPPVQPQQPIQQPMDQQYNLHDMDMSNLDFSQSLGGFGGPPGDVLEHFDFDSFLNTETGGDGDGGFNFDTNFGMEGDVGVGAE